MGLCSSLLHVFGVPVVTCLLWKILWPWYALLWHESSQKSNSEAVPMIAFAYLWLPNIGNAFFACFFYLRNSPLEWEFLNQRRKIKMLSPLFGSLWYALFSSVLSPWVFANVIVLPVIALYPFAIEDLFFKRRTRALERLYHHGETTVEATSFETTQGDKADDYDNLADTPRPSYKRIRVQYQVEDQLFEKSFQATDGRFLRFYPQSNWKLMLIDENLPQSALPVEALTTFFNYGNPLFRGDFAFCMTGLAAVWGFLLYFDEYYAKTYGKMDSLSYSELDTKFYCDVTILIVALIIPVLASCDTVLLRPSWQARLQLGHGCVDGIVMATKQIHVQEGITKLW